MPSLVRLGLLVAPLIALYSFVAPKLTLLGAYKKVENVNTHSCKTVEGLVGCEDAWISEAFGLAYLPCTPLESRLPWLPAITHLNATALPAISKDHISLYDFKTGKHEKLTIKGMPDEGLHNLNLHAIDIYQRPSDREHLTVFVNSHRPPADRSTAPVVGANSVIEIFETRMGSKELQYVMTVDHPLVRTPNNIVAMGERSFYFTNDHRRKVHWSRAYQIVYREPSDIIYCDASSGLPICGVAADGVIHPNGIARGPRDLLYSASSGQGQLEVWEIQSSDHSLVPAGSIPVPHLSDNLHVASDGTIFVASFPRVFDLLKHFKTGGMDPNARSPVEVYAVRNDTSDAQYFGHKYSVKLAFASDGKLVSGVTTAAPYKNKLLLTGVMTENVVICDIV